MSLGGLDVGTTVCRLIAFDEVGNVLASSYREYPLIVTGGFFEVSPIQIWEAVCEICKEVSLKIKNDPIKFLAVSAMGDTLLITNDALDPVGNAILAFDTRSKEVCRELTDRIGFEKWYSITGMPAHSMATATKIAWYMKAHDRQRIRSPRFMCAEDFIIGRLTGNPTMSWSTAARTMAFDITRKRWSDEILALLGVDKEVFSSVEPSATVVGSLSSLVAADIGLDPHTQVVTAGHDQICSAIGSGAIRDGIVSDNTGTFECVIAAIAEDRRRKVDRLVLARRNLAFYSHGPNGLWAAFAWFNAGSLVKWFKENLFPSNSVMAEEKDIFEQMFSRLPDRPSNIRVLPHFAGSGTPWLDSDATGVLVGLTLGSSRHDILKGILEGIGYDLMINLQGMEEAGVLIKGIRSTGGGTKSEKWNQLKADMSGKEITIVDNPEASALGAAICAGAAGGTFSTIEEGADRMVTLGKVYVPDQERFSYYEANLESYKELNALIASLHRTKT
jgi:xylulokinase